MPTPGKDEKEKDFISRCIPIVMKEGTAKDNKQATAICYEKWREKHGGKKPAKKSTKRDLTLSEKEALVRQAWENTYGDGGQDFQYSYPRYVFEDYIVVLVKAKYIKVPYSWGDDGIEFADVKEWETVEHSFKASLPDDTIVRRTLPRPIRAVVSEDGTERYECYGVLFSDKDNLDNYGTYFDKDTNYYLDWFNKRPWLYHHGMHPMMGLTQVGEWISAEIDDEGVFLIGEMLESFKHKEAVKELIRAEVLYPSQGTLGYAMDFNWETGHVIDWPLVEVSSTVRPANLQQQAISLEVGRAIRALQGGILMEENAETPTQKGLTEAPPQTEPKVGDTPIVPATAADTDSREAISQLAQAVTAVDQGLRDLHKELREMRSIVNGLSQSEANRMKDLVTGKSWLEGLWSVSRQGEPMGEGETPPSPFIHAGPAPDEGGVGILASIFGQA